MYEYIERNSDKIKKNIKAYFQNARLGLLKYDELNKSQIDEEVDDLFDNALNLNNKLIEGIIDDMDLDESDYPIPMLNDRYNTTTNYVFANEFERKRDRYKENVISSIYGVADNQGKRKDFNQKAVISALTSMAFLKLQENNARILAQQIEECAVDDERYLFLQEGIKQGVEYVRWVSMDDGKDCDYCHELNGQIFPIDACPDRDHYGCRCELEYVSEEELEELEKSNIDSEAEISIYDDYDYSVDWNEIESEDYKSKLGNIPNSKKSVDAIYQRIKECLSRMDGKKTEELHAINLNNGKEVSSILKGVANASRIERTPEFNIAILEAEQKGAKVLLLHNHPLNIPPSNRDINALFRHESAVGITVGHKGSIYYFTRPNGIIEDREFDVAFMKQRNYNDPIVKHEKALEVLSQKYDFTFKVIR